MVRIRQTVDTGEITDLPTALQQGLSTGPLEGRIRPGMRVAITAGSRGIDHIQEVLRRIVAWLRSRGADPFLVPAMGSHGGEPPKGPVSLLAALGITEETAGAPVEEDPETLVVGEVEGLPVHCLRAAARADGILVVNRIKPHTSCTGEYESGLAKMLAVGLGGRPGAAVVHAQGVKSIPGLIPKMAEAVLCRTKVLGGIALL
jgi:hypothetical protein